MASQRSALGAFLPNVSASYRWSKGKETNIDPVAEGEPDEQDIGPSKNLTLSGNMTLLDLTNFFDYAQARTSRAAARLDVIDSEQDLLVDSLEVGKQPNSMVMDRSHTLWILSDGGFEGSPYGQENGSLMRIPAGARNAELVHRFAPGDRPTDLVINGTGDTLYFLNRHVYRLAIGQLAPPEKVIDYPSDEATGAFYALAVDPRSSELYVADAMDYIQRGMVYRYSAGAVLRDSFRVGITPGAFGIQP